MRLGRVSVLSILVAGAFSDCCPVQKQVEVFPVEEPLMPVSEFRLPRRKHNPHALKFRIAVMNFVDQTKAAGELVKTLPDILTTALHGTGRFDLYDRGQLRDKTLEDSQKDANLMLGQGRVDAVLQGAITQFGTDTKKIVCDIRITDRKEAVMFAKSATFSYTGTLDLSVNRDDLSSLAKEIAQRYPRLGERTDFRVVSVSGNSAELNVGRESGLIQGMTALVIAPGDLVRDTETSEVLSSTYYIGELYVMAVDEKKTRTEILPYYIEERVRERRRDRDRVRGDEPRDDETRERTRWRRITPEMRVKDWVRFK